VVNNRLCLHRYSVEAMRRGAFDYLPKPFTPDQLLLLIRKITEVRTLEQKVAALQEALNEAAPEAEFDQPQPGDAKNPGDCSRVADSDATLLIFSGESGTGKTMLAQNHPFLEPSVCQKLWGRFLPLAVAGASGERAFRSLSRGLLPARCEIIWAVSPPAKAAPYSSDEIGTCPTAAGQAAASLTGEGV